MVLEFGTSAEIFGFSGFFQVEPGSQPVLVASEPASTLQRRLPVAITATPEFRLTHHLRLCEALITLYFSIPPLRFLSFLGRSSSSKDHESPPTR
ncbi:hypothetical protein PIB30_038004 [Stylosanthes scabra]|uniref:Uncharacterized protein n=1 Tax=Stylosanthes scabra TaxID=79078 RepID=A0ABU6RDZ9_9FABA|nr:hypothetical protein [Stylosanthes scabra]